MNNTRLRCMTASAGTIIRRDSSFTHVILLVKFRPLQQMLSSAFGVAGSGFRPLTKILDCCLPLKSGSFSTPVRRYCLSTPLSILGLVSLYLTNYPSDTLSLCLTDHACPFFIPVFVGSTRRQVDLSPMASYVQGDSTPVHQVSSLSRPFDLQCLKRANSVRSEPEPNSPSYRLI